MRSSDKTGKLMSALAKAQAELQDPKQSQRGHHGTYASLADGLPAARRVLAQHGVALMQAVDLERRALVTRLACADEWVEGDYPLLFHDSKPQQQGSNTTYARRYALWAMLGLAPEDDDGQGSNDSGGNHRNWHQKPPKPAAPSGHHPSFKGHQGKFFARLKELGWGYKDQVAPWCESNGWGRPSGWATPDREQLLQDLANGPKAAELLDWVEGQK